MAAVDETEFREYVTGHLVGVRRTAFLLCGDWHRAEDIAQTALTKLFLAWRRLRDHGELDGYVRQIVVRTYLDEQRRRWHGEQPTEQLPDRPGPSDFPEDRLVLLRALREVPPRQRAALVLRYWEDLSVEDAADVLGCSVGTVKSSAARGLASLRAVLISHGVSVVPDEFAALPQEEVTDRA